MIFFNLHILETHIQKKTFESVDNLSGTSKSAWITKWSPFPVLAHPAM